eukprot:scaffold103221_cov21-Tisochrysis_lutea.AAC.1
MVRLATGRERFNVGWCVSLFSGRDVSNITISHWKQCNQGDKIRQPDKIAALTVQLCSLQPLFTEFFSHHYACYSGKHVCKHPLIIFMMELRGDCCTAYTAYLPFLGWPPKSALLLFDICPGKAPLVWSLQSLAYIPTPLLAWLYTIHIEAKETCIIVPRAKVVFDIGRCPQRAVFQQTVLISHGHLDHVGGLPFHVSSRNVCANSELVGARAPHLEITVVRHAHYAPCLQ